MKCKKLAALFLAFVMVLSMAACGAKPADTPATAAPKADAPAAPAAPAAEGAKDVKITVFHYMAQTTKQAGLDAVEAAFAAEHPEYNITQISEALGFPDVYSFSKIFKRELGLSPNEYRKEKL